MQKFKVKREWYSEHFKEFLESKNRYQILYGGRGCFGGGQLIETKQGLKPISEIKVGDTVISANISENKQEFKDVLNVFKYKNIDKCIKINYDNKEIICTLDHKFYYNGEFKEIGKILQENGIIINQKNTTRI
jgi:hypothetical protein